MRFVETSKRWDFTRILEELKHYRLISAGLFFSLIIGTAIYMHFFPPKSGIGDDDYYPLDPIEAHPPIFHKYFVVYSDYVKVVSHENVNGKEITRIRYESKGYIGKSGEEVTNLHRYKYERPDYQKREGEEIVRKRSKANKEFSPCYFGTDGRGRDVLRRTIIGIRKYPIPCLIAVVISILLGTALGISSSNTQESTRANTIQPISQGLLDALESMPKYITILIVIFLFPNPGFRRIAIILGILNTPRFGKLVSTKIQSLKDRDFIESAYGLGLSPFTVIRRHILRYNCMPLFITQACVQLAEVILIEVALAYIGDISARHKPPLNWPRGVTGDFTLWGNILIEGRWTLSTAWWISLCPLMAIVITVSMCFFLSASINRMVLQQREKIEG
jgi:peptide/nickel transport system permease protein